jgi:hypothetical protein
MTTKHTGGVIMTESVDGTTPLSETANQVKAIVKHPDEEQLNPEFFRLDQSELDQPVAKTVLTAIPIRKPEALEFIRVHPDPEFRMEPVPFIALKQSREYYLVKPELRRELRPREYWIGQIFLATNRLDHPFFWIVTIQSPSGREGNAGSSVRGNLVGRLRISGFGRRTSGASLFGSPGTAHRTENPSVAR